VTHYVNKDNDLHEELPGFLTNYPESKILFIIRDPRDVVASWLKTPVWHTHPFDPARSWNNLNTRAYQLLRRYPNSIHLVKYEDLVSSSETVIREILKFAKLPAEAVCFETSNSQNEQNVLWKNLSRPIMRGNTKNYKKQLSKLEILAIESQVSSALLKNFGYYPENPKILAFAFRHLQKIEKLSKKFHQYFTALTLKKFHAKSNNKSIEDMKFVIDGGRREFKERVYELLERK
jgi:hypothetical protein